MTNDEITKKIKDLKLEIRLRKIQHERCSGSGHPRDWGFADEYEEDIIHLEHEIGVLEDLLVQDEKQKGLDHREIRSIELNAYRWDA